MIQLNIHFDFAAIDNNAVLISVVGYVIVFIALVSLYFIFSSLPLLIQFTKKKMQSAKERQRSLIGKNNETEKEADLTGEINAAISTALYLYFNEMHDDESRKMTVERVSRVYSPWSSKIYAVRNTFNRR